MTEERIPALKNVRSELPLSDDDLAVIRKSVLQKMSGRGSAFTAGGPFRPSVGVAWPARMAAAIGVVLAALAGFIAISDRNEPARPARRASTAVERRPAAGATALPGTAQAPVQSAAAMETVPMDRPSGRGAIFRKSLTKRGNGMIKPTAVPAVDRIELQTSDPDVRIIWIESQTTEESSPSR